MQWRRDQRFAVSCQRIEPRRKIDGVAGDRVFGGRAAADPRRNHLATGQTDVQAQWLTVAIVQSCSRLVHVERASHGAFGVVAMRYWRTEDRHDGVSDPVDHRTAVAVYPLFHCREKARQHGLDLLGVTAGTKCCVARYVGKQHRGLAALANCSNGCIRSVGGCQVLNLTT